MRRGLALFGVSAAAFLSTVGSLEAKKVYYEVDGQRYSYSTRNRAQVKEARERMAAAGAASSARARGEAERANPLSRIFPAPVETQAQTQAPATIVSSEDATASLQARRLSRAETALKSRRPAKQSRAERRRLQQEARAEKARERREMIAERRQRAAEAKRKKLAAAQARKEAAQRAAAQARSADPSDAGHVVARSEPVRDVSRQEPGKTDGPASTQSLRPAPAKTVSFDLASGIKTIERTDGTLQEEPFDPVAIAKLGIAEPVPDTGLTEFVDQLRAQAR